MTDINRAALLAALSLVKPALAAQAYLPALTHIRFAGGWATAYNDVSAIQVRADIGADVCVPGDLLIRALGSFSGESVMVQPNKDAGVVVTSGRSKVKLPTLAVKDFPFDVPEDAADEVVLTASVLRGITRCLISVGSNPKFAAQMGVTLDTSEGCAVLFSTDDFTISRCQTKSKLKLPAEAPVILPTFFCEQLVALGKAFPDDEVVLVLLPGALLAEFGKSARLFSKTPLDLMPLDFPLVLSKHVELDGLKGCLATIPDAFDAALGRALLVLGGEASKATQFTVTGGTLRLTSACQMGDADDSMPYEAQKDPPGAFYADPALVARASKACALVGFLPRGVVLTDAECQFVHLIAHIDRK